jgi:hypothetical protein
MTRTQFTDSITRLIQWMIDDGEEPILDFALRSLPEQQRLFAAGLSKCDGIKIVSAHQLGKAVDIYFQTDGKLAEPKKGYEYWHLKWRQMGGKEMVDWDKGHWEAA